MIKMRNIVLIFWILWFIFPVAGLASDLEADSLEKITENQLEVLDVREVEKLIGQIDREMEQFIPELSLRETIEKLKNGEISFNPQAFLTGSLKFLLREVGANLALMGKLVLLTVICAVLGNLQNAFEKGTIAKLAYAICFLVLISLVISSFQMSMAIGKEAIKKMVHFYAGLNAGSIDFTGGIRRIHNNNYSASFYLVHFRSVKYFIQCCNFPFNLFRSSA